MHEHKGWGGGEEWEIIENKKIKYVQIEWVTTLTDLLAILSMIILKTLLQYCWYLLNMDRNSIEIALYHDSRYERNTHLKVTQTYTKCYAESVSIEQYFTCPHSEPNKFSPHFPKLFLQNIFQYYSSINGYDFLKVSSLHDCIPNLKTYMAPTI